MPRLLLPLLLLALAACADPGSGDADLAGPPGSTTPTASPAAPPASEAAPSSTPASEDQAYVGLTEQQALARAEAQGVVARVLSRDGESFPHTMDLREDRLNFVVEDGRVTAVHRG